jgi:hypothetical protein
LPLSIFRWLNPTFLDCSLVQPSIPISMDEIWWNPKNWANFLGLITTQTPKSPNVCLVSAHQSFHQSHKNSLW